MYVMTCNWLLMFEIQLRHDGIIAYMTVVIADRSAVLYDLFSNVRRYPSAEAP